VTASVTKGLHSGHPSVSESIDAAVAIERAYGLLWRDTSAKAGSPSSDARKLLLALMDKRGQRRGINYALEKFGHVTDHEALRDFP